MKLIIVVMLLVSPVFAQLNDGIRQECAKRNRKLLIDLSQDNALFSPISRGETGDGIERDWMNDMRQYGVRQISVEIAFTVKQDSIQISIMRTRFFKSYYDFSKTITPDKRLEDLPKKLAISIFQEAISLIKSISASTPTRGTFYLNLLDDPCLPVYQTDMPTLEPL